MPLNHLETRNLIVDEIKRTFIGPLKGEEEELDFNPMNIYMSGILYPTDYENVDPENSGMDGLSINDEEGLNEKPESEVIPSQLRGKSREELLENTEELTLTSSFKPSAMGISFIVNNLATVKVKVKYAFYTKREEVDGKKKKFFYKSNPNNSEIEISFSSNAIRWQTDNWKSNELNSNFKIPLLLQGSKPKLVLAVTKRKYNDINCIVTLTLINSQKKGDKIDDADNDDSRKSFFDIRQCFFRNEILVESFDENPVFLPFDDLTEEKNLSDEELNLKLLYRNYNVYAAGHGCAAGWNDLGISDTRAKSTIFTEVIPQYPVAGSEYEPEELIVKDEDEQIIEDCNILFIKRLSGADFNKQDEPSAGKDCVIQELRSFIDKYNYWINLRLAELPSLETELLRNRARANMEICRGLYERMKKGIEILSKNDKAYTAFCDANKAMYMQRAMAGFIKERKKNINEDLFPGDTFNGRNVDEELPDWRNQYSYLGNEFFFAKWRPFQLAFFLSQIRGIVETGSDDRDTVDLIWFATGGGKTEAYLGLTAFNIFFRRLREVNPDNGAGITVMMRYTLRLLNMQQFQRASSLICACELIRRDKSVTYGNIPISLGIWVGKITPNK